MTNKTKKRYLFTISHQENANFDLHAITSTNTGMASICKNSDNRSDVSTWDNSNSQRNDQIDEHKDLCHA